MDNLILSFYDEYKTRLFVIYIESNTIKKYEKLSNATEHYYLFPFLNKTQLQLMKHQLIIIKTPSNSDKLNCSS